MDAMAAHQEAAYELLYRWIQRKAQRRPFSMFIYLYQNYFKVNVVYST